MRKLIFILCFIPLFAFGQFDGRDTLHAVNIKATGDLVYGYRHGFMHFRDSAVVISATQNVWYKVNNASNSLWQMDEFEYLTKTADTVRIDYLGDYYGLFTLRISSPNLMDRYQLGIFKNGILQNLSSATINTNGGQATITLQWYFVSLAVNDKISLRLRNVTNNNDPTLIGGSFYLRKEPEN